MLPPIAASNENHSIVSLQWPSHRHKAILPDNPSQDTACSPAKAGAVTHKTSAVTYHSNPYITACLNVQPIELLPALIKSDHPCTSISALNPVYNPVRILLEVVRRRASSAHSTYGLHRTPQIIAIIRRSPRGKRYNPYKDSYKSSGTGAEFSTTCRMIFTFPSSFKRPLNSTEVFL